MVFVVNVKTAVSKLNNQVGFLQPVYESITNSLEANASKIRVEFDLDQDQQSLSLGGEPIHRINGFTITDNGDGFNRENIISFKELWTSNKKSLGCKGVGRLTWLKVFKNIDIYSRLPNSDVSIKFTEDFKEEDIIENLSLLTAEEKLTSIKFFNVSDIFYHFNTKKELIDNREKADIEKIYVQIKKHLLVKLALLKKNKISFEILIKAGEKELKIEYQNIPELTQIDFEIEDYNKNPQNFSLYYDVADDGLNQKDLFYCADGRTVSKFSENISLEKIKNKDSIIMLLASKYLDERVNDERNGFTIDKLQNNESMVDPLSFPKINEALKQKVEEVLIKHYPDIIKSNENEIEKAIKEVPYLSSYICEDNSLIKNKSGLITNAKKAFEKEKEISSAIFSRMLTQKNIDPKFFKESIAKLNKVAVEELGEYILYRQQIIEGLKKAISDKNRKEDYIHDLIMQMRIVVDEKIDEKDRHFFTNFWLFDDKFMTYSYAASDKTMAQITKDINASYDNIYKSKDRPDLAVFYNKDGIQKDVIVCELKGANASSDEKNKSLTELPNNIGTIRRNIPDSNRIWGYIITSIDEDFEESIINTDKFQPIFSNNKDGKAYYAFFKNLNAHITIIDLASIITDADSRNKVFLDILSKNRNNVEGCNG